MGDSYVDIEKGCLQEPEQDNLGVSAEFDQEVTEAAAATRTVQGLPGVMDTQSQAAPEDATQVAADRVVAAEEEAQEEQKWQSFMAEHFGQSLSHLSLTSCGKHCIQPSQSNGYVIVRRVLPSIEVDHFRWRATCCSHTSAPLEHSLGSKII